MRQYERDPDSGQWHDGLLMELLADERTGPSGLVFQVRLECGADPRLDLGGS